MRLACVITVNTHSWLWWNQLTFLLTITFTVGADGGRGWGANAAHHMDVSTSNANEQQGVTSEPTQPVRASASSTVLFSRGFFFV